MKKVISIAFLFTAVLFAIASIQELRGSAELSGAELAAYNQAVHPWVNLAGTGACLLLAIMLWARRPSTGAAA